MIQRARDLDVTAYPDERNAAATALERDQAIPLHSSGYGDCPEPGLVNGRCVNLRVPRRPICSCLVHVSDRGVEYEFECGCGAYAQRARASVNWRRPASGLIHHSDRGLQYAAAAYRVELERHGMRASMSRFGNGRDNAVAESFFATLKGELDHEGAWRTRADARRALFDYIELFYNGQRRHSTLGYLTPLAFERRWQEQTA